MGAEKKCSTVIEKYFTNNSIHHQVALISASIYKLKKQQSKLDFNLSRFIQGVNHRSIQTLHYK